MGKLVLVVLWALSLCEDFAIRSEAVAYATDSTEKFEHTWSMGCSKNFNFLLQHGPMAKRSAPPHSEVQNHVLLMPSQTEDTPLETSLELKGRVTVPFDDKVISIHPYGIYTRIFNRKHTISLIWNHQDALSLTLDSSYKGQLCGLCGKFEEGTKTIYGPDFLDANKLDILGHTCYSKPTKESSCPTNPLCEVPISSSFFSCFENQITDEYVKMCSADLCTCKELKCECATLEELARQCSKELFQHYKDWRTQIGCGTVLDNIRGRNTCIKKAECPCEHDGEIYESGKTRTTSCQSCTCESGAWSCSHLKCPGRCKIEEATCVTTFDNNYYCMIGECSYYAVSTEDWTIMVEIHQCQAAFKQSCLQRVTLTKNQTSFVFTNDGKIHLDQNVVTMPLRTGGITIFQQSSMYIQVVTTFGLKMQVQIFPAMQLYISLSEDLKEITKGLCGVFNDNAEDDFLSQGGIVESTPITFANSWKFKDSCPDAIIPPPCVSSENEKYAKDNCRSIKDPNGPFSICHSAIDSVHYYEMCVAATCACENINDCLCAGLGVYVHECAAHGIIVKNWRRNICNTPCANTQVFENDMRACNRTCRSLSQYDYTCEVKDVPVYGCGCPEGKYMDNTGACIDKSDCSCYIDGMAIKKGQSIPLNGRICICENGKPYCSTVPATTSPGCLNGKAYFDCRNVDNFCAKTCKEYNKPCSNSNCVPGCVCPDNLVEDDSGRCVAPEQCPCSFGGESYAPGITILRDCNNCTCKAGTWECTKNSCPKDCLVYGDGHYVTFDGKRYSFDGNCEYTLVEDRCNQGKGTIQILIDSVPCCERGVTCSRIIRILFEDKELKLTDGRVIRTVNSHGQTQCADDSYSLHTVGLYLILTFSNGITVIWDKRTRVSITLDPRWKNKICGLCGNFNGDVVDDLTTKGNSVVANVLEFGNSWKSTMSCSNAVNQTFPCDRNPYCLAWAQRKCSIIKDTVFQACHKKVDPTPFYEACVQEACACDLEGKHLGFCTAVAVYAEACNKAGVCIRWRTPDLCPVYCDYYNNPDECSWHYQPCGTLTTRTCSDHYVGKKFSAILEGCYAKCPVSAPYLDENIMKCVKLPDCTCYYNGQILQPGEVTRNDCEECKCRNGNLTCIKETTTTRPTTGSTPEGVTTTITLTTTKFTPVTTTPKGTTTTTAIERTTTTKVTPTSTVPTTVSTASSTAAVSTTTQERTTTPVTEKATTTELICHGKWSPWINEHTPSEDNPGDFELLDPNDNEHCSFPSEVITNIQCRFVDQPERPISESPDNVTCDKDKGLTCVFSKSAFKEKKFCFDYQVRICCEPVSPVSTISTSASVSTTTQETTTTPVTEKTTTAAETTTPRATTTASVNGKTTTTGSSSDYCSGSSEGVTTTVKATTGSTTGSTPEVTTTTVKSTTTSSTPGSTPEVPIPSRSTTTVSTASSTTEVVCHGKWSPWINDHTPSEGSPGDSELLDPKDNEYCSFPSEVITNIQCRFVDQPERPISESPDNVTCDKDKGLTCVVSKSSMEEKRFCFDYQVRICCEPVSPVSTTTTSTTSTLAVSTTTQETTTTPVTEKATTAVGLTTTVTPTTTGSTTGSRPEVTPTTVKSTTTSSTPSSTPEVPIPSTVTTTVSTASSTTEIVCHGKWSPWINEHTPSEGSPGDFELLNPKANEYCSFPSEVITNIQCQFVDQPERPISESPDNVTCDKDKGFTCAVSKSAMEEKRFCFDYQVRICCEPVSRVSTATTSTTSTSAVSTTQETTTTPVTEKTTTAAFKKSPSIRSVLHMLPFRYKRLKIYSNLNHHLVL
ncbi:mucin-2-like [Carcharodon carcharias]|uniref:mucin-2-like n=1 Tax=Carcharodon carcharias TaxID=13397 RepID=UPI001B7E0B1C|nr:mucin-2-like [Carcharodon carcharias]